MPAPPREESRRLRLFAAAAVAAATFAVMVPSSCVRWPVSEDALEYAAIAHSWVEGRGFVNPVMLSFVLDDATPPLPGFATRAPVLPALLAIPIALGASFHGLGILHQVCAALVVAAMVLAARRSMSLAAAVACAVTFAWSTGWLVVSQALVTEVYAVGALLLVMATARGVPRSLGGALLGACVGVLAWLTRPNLGLLVPVVWLACASELGLRAALRSRPLWLYGIAAAGLYEAIVLAHQAATGLAPYQQYRVLLTSVTFRDFAAYETLSSGAFDFVRSHGAAVRAAWLEQLRGLGAVLFTPGFYPPVGWLAIPAVAWALRSRDPNGLERRVVAVAGIVLLLPLLLLYGPSEPRRYSIVAIAALWIAELGWLDALRRALRERLRDRAERGGSALLSPAALLLVAAVFVAATGLPRVAAVHATFWREYRKQGVLTFLNEFDETARRFCPLVEPGAVVAAGPSPWSFFYWCGNPTMWTPNDLTSLASLDRFLAEHAPEYIVAHRSLARRLLRASPRLEQVGRHEAWTLHRVKRPFRSPRRWQPPPPLPLLGARTPGHAP